MARLTATEKIWLIVSLIVIVILLVSYWLFKQSDFSLSGNQEEVSPPIALDSSELPLEVIEAENGLPDQKAIQQSEAKAFVENLAPNQEQNQQPARITIEEHQDQFVRPDSVIRLPKLEQRVTTLEKLLGDDSLSDDTPVTIEYVEETEAETTLTEIKDQQEDPVEPVTIITGDGREITAPVTELLEDESIDKSATVTQIHRRTQQKETTIGELAGNDEQTEIETTLTEIEDQQANMAAPVTIITGDGREITAPITELLQDESLDKSAAVTQIRRNKQKDSTAVELTGNAAQGAELDIASDQEINVIIDHGEQELVLRDIFGDEVIEDDSLLYLHRVTEADYQGLWGIIQSGLIDRFRRGLSIKGFSNKSTVSVTIPADADEPLPDGLSSYLGHILNGKVKSSYVYNLSTKSMGQDPNLIFPGQQLIIIRFSADELRDIYMFFAEQRSVDVKSFAIGD